MAIPLGFPDDWIIKVVDDEGPITASFDRAIKLGIAEEYAVWCKFTYAGTGGVNVQLLGTFSKLPPASGENVFQNVALGVTSSQNIVVLSAETPRRFPYIHVRFTLPGGATATLTNIFFYVSARNRGTWVS